MKRRTLFSIVAVFFVFCTISKADNPVTWTFDAETKGEDVSWDSNPEYIDNCYVSYDYTWEITKVEAYTKIIWWQWIDISFLLDEVSGTGTHNGALPATVLDERIEEGEVGADIQLMVDEDGFGHAYVSNISLGEVEGINVQGVRIEGYITINGSQFKPINNINQGTYFMEIQNAITEAQDDDTIIVDPGTYEGCLRFLGKNITLKSTAPQDTDIVDDTIIIGNGSRPTIEFDGTETADCNLLGFTITGGEAAGAIEGNYALANIKNCVIADNISEEDGAGIRNFDGTISFCTIKNNTADLSCRGGAMANCNANIDHCVISGNYAAAYSALYNCNGEIRNCTIANNSSLVGPAVYSCNGKIVNSIIYFSSPALSVGDCNNVTFCCLESYPHGAGNFDHDPKFIAGTNYQLSSQAGSWDYETQTWVTDSVTSRCIDAGGQSYDLGDEYSSTDNLRINLGAYGGTAQASKTPAGWTLISDINNDGIIGFEDFAFLTENFEQRQKEITGDLNSDMIVNLEDLSIMSQQWLEKTTWFRGL